MLEYEFIGDGDGCTMVNLRSRTQQNLDLLTLWAPEVEMLWESCLTMPSLHLDCGRRSSPQNGDISSQWVPYAVYAATQLKQYLVHTYNKLIQDLNQVPQQANSQLYKMLIMYSGLDMLFQS